MGFIPEQFRLGQILSRIVDIVLLIICLKLLLDYQHIHNRLIDIEDFTLIQINDLKSNLKSLAKAELGGNSNDRQLKLNQHIPNHKYFKSKFSKLSKDFHQLKDLIEQFNPKLHSNKQVLEETHIDVFNLNAPFELKYQDIKCRNCSISNYVSAILCVHDLEKDKYISKEIWEQGSYKPELLEIFAEYLLKNPSWIVLDIGAHVGQYSIFAAKMGHKVIAVEPFTDSNSIMHKAVVLSNIQNKITLLSNAIWNQSNLVMKLETKLDSISEQGLIEFAESKHLELKNTKYIAQTIIFDDLIGYLPKNDNNDAIIKIDIEGNEPYAFENANELFKILNIKVIFMNWAKIQPKSNQKQEKIEKMLKFLDENELVPFNLANEELNIGEWDNWPSEIIWKK